MLSILAILRKLAANSRLGPGARAGGGPAAATLLAEVVRHPSPKRVLLVGADAQLLPALGAQLLPGDELTVVSTDADELRQRGEELAAGLPHVAKQIRLAPADPGDGIVPAGDPGGYDHVVFTEPLGAGTDSPVTTGPDQLRAARAAIRPEGTVSFAMPIAPRTDNGQVDDLIAAHAIRSEMVAAALPPVRVHHLRFTPAAPEIAEKLAPAYTPSQVPLTRRMSLDIDGVTVAAALAGTAAATRLLTRKRPLLRHLWLLPAAAAVPAAAFFRDPERIPPTDADAIVSSADGRVLSVEHITDERFGPDKWLRIAVFLSVLDVHINRSPVAGRITQIIDANGGYADARSMDAEHNVAKYTVLETPRGRVVVAQRSGLIACRIVQRSRPGALLTRGEKFGLIRFGSRTDVYLPADHCTPTVTEGERTVGGETIIARWN